MQFESFSDFLHMGGYAFYVWISFAVTLVVMLGIVIESKISHGKLIQQIIDEQDRKKRIKNAMEKQASRSDT